MPIQGVSRQACTRGSIIWESPVFPSLEEDSNAEDTEEAKPENDNAATLDKFKSKKSKAAAKSGGYKFQGEFMLSLGLSNEEIAKFQDPYHWLSYFPPLSKEDLIAFGLGCVWRSSIITTYMNPYYDSFVRRQMSKLKSLGKIVKDMRYTIYSSEWMANHVQIMIELLMRVFNHKIMF